MGSAEVCWGCEPPPDRIPARWQAEEGVL